MKKYLIPLLIIITTISIIVLIVINNEPKKEEKENITIYNRETKNYINNEYYSSTIEKYELTDTNYKYIKETIYNDGNNSINSYEGTFFKEDNKLLLDNHETIYLVDNKLCLDEQCNISYSINSTIIDNYINDFNPNNYIVTLKHSNFESIEDNFKYIVISQTGCPHCERYKKELLEVVKDYKINIYFIDLQDLTTKDYNFLIDEFNIKSAPTTLIYVNNNLIDKFTGYINKTSINDILFKNQITKR